MQIRPSQPLKPQTAQYRCLPLSFGARIVRKLDLKKGEKESR